MLQSRVSIHASKTPLPEPHDRLLSTASYSPEKVIFHKCYLASMKKVDIDDYALKATRAVEDKVHF